MLVKKIVETYRRKSFRRANRRIYRRIRFALLKLRYINQEHIKRKVKDFEMYLLKNDVGLSMTLALYGEREKKHTKQIRDALNEGDVVLDIGANLGYFALNEWKKVGESGKIYALEPIKENYELLQKNIELNDAQNIEMFNLAISNFKGRRKMIKSNRSNHATFEEVEKLSQNEKEEVEVTTLDEFLKDKQTPDIIRMDVEGHEYDILMNQEILEKDIDLLIEFHADIMGEDKAEELLNYLNQKGYKTENYDIKHRKQIHLEK